MSTTGIAGVGASIAVDGVTVSIGDRISIDLTYDTAAAYLLVGSGYQTPPNASYAVPASLSASFDGLVLSQNWPGSAFTITDNATVWVAPGSPGYNQTLQFYFNFFPNLNPPEPPASRPFNYADIALTLRPYTLPDSSLPQSLDFSGGSFYPGFPDYETDSANLHFYDAAGDQVALLVTLDSLNGAPLSPAPIPAAGWLLLCGLGGLGLFARTRREA